MCELMLIHGETFSVDQQADLSKTCLFGNLEYDFSSTVCAVSRDSFGRGEMTAG